MSILPKAIYRFNTILIKIPMADRRQGTNTVEKTGSSRKKALKCKGATKEPQEVAVIKDGATESGVQSPKASAFPPGFSISEIKNKHPRHLMFTRWKQQQQKKKLAAKKKLKKEREALGDKAPPKPIPKTIDNQRVYDETTVDPADEEVMKNYLFVCCLEYLLVDFYNGLTALLLAYYLTCYRFFNNYISQ